MESNKETKLVAELVGAIRREGLNAIEASNVLEEARRTYLSRCEHVTKKCDVSSQSFINCNDCCNR